MEQRWINLEGFDCPNCGYELEVFTSSEQEEDDEYSGTFVYDGDPVRCLSQCGFKSNTIVYDEDSVGIDNDGNMKDLNETE